MLNFLPSATVAPPQVGHHNQQVFECESRLKAFLECSLLHLLLSCRSLEFLPLVELDIKTFHVVPFSISHN